MVYCAAYCDIKEKDNLKKTFKVDDSKKLSEEKREKIFEQMKKSTLINYELEILNPDLLSNKMLRRNKYNLNLISHDSAIELIKKIEKNNDLEIKEIYVDTVVNLFINKQGDSNKYEKKILEIFPSVNVKVSKKAG
jgi:ribonuclease H2 subunit A